MTVLKNVPWRLSVHLNLLTRHPTLPSWVSHTCFQTLIRDGFQQQVLSTLIPRPLYRVLPSKYLKLLDPQHLQCARRPSVSRQHFRHRFQSAPRPAPQHIHARQPNLQRHRRRNRLPFRRRRNLFDRVRHILRKARWLRENIYIYLI